jgi:hypothetical protein
MTPRGMGGGHHSGRWVSRLWNGVVFLSEGNSELYRNSSPDNVPWLPRMVDYELGNLQNSPR